MRLNVRTYLVIIITLLAISVYLWLDHKSPEADWPSIKPIALDDATAPDVSVALTPESMEVLHDFQSWMIEFRAGERGEDSIQQGLVLAEERRSTMLSLIQLDPRAALRAALGYADYAALPDQIQALVEKPYTSTGDVEVIAICDHDFHTPEYHVNVYLENNQRLRTAMNAEMRTGLSKLDVPLQGIQLDGWTALQPTVLDRVDGADADWAWETLPSGNPDPDVDFFTGEPLGANPIITVAGGFTFLFSDETTLEAMEIELRAYDNLAGRYTGSSAIFSEEVQEYVLAKGFPVEQVRDSQNQLSINDTTGDKTALFIRIVFPDNMEAPLSDTDLEAQIDGAVSGHLNGYSYNQTSMNATVTSKVYTASMNGTEYAYTGNGDMVDEQDLWDEAVAAYKVDVPGDPFDTYDIVGVSFPKIDGVGWAGLGTVGGANSKHWLNGVPSTGTIVHEFGHNYGLGHSNYWVFNKTNAASIDPIDVSGENEEYGDFWDVMGKGDENLGHFHMAAKRYLSWLAANQVKTIDETGDSGTYRVYRFDHKDASSGLQGLEIKKDGDENYWIGFRRAYESNASYYQGAYILWERPPAGTDRNQGWIIDTTPDSASERQDAGISLGRTYSDTTAGVHITPFAIGGSSPEEYLDVVVNYGPFAGNNAPTISSMNVPGTGDARTSIALSVDSNDQDGDTLAYSWDLGNGEVYASSSSVNVTFTVGGPYDVTVTVSDMKGGVTTETSQIVIDDPVNTWTTRAEGLFDNDLHSLASNSSHVVAAGRGVIIRSEDGSTWEDVSPDNLGFLGNMIIEGICWTGSEFVAAGAEFSGGVGQYHIISSPDGSSWTRELMEPVPSASPFPIGFKDVASNQNGSLVIAVGADGGVYTRKNGGDWTNIDFGLGDDDTLNSIAFGNEVFVVGGRNSGAGQELLLYRTKDGEIWEDLKDNSDLMEWWGLNSIEFFNNFFVGSGFFTRTLFSENGGINWQTLEQGSSVNEIESFAFGNGVYYAIGIKHPDNTSQPETLINLVSSNGKIWKEVASEVAESGSAILYFKNTFIIVGDDGSIKQSGLVEAADEILAAPVISPTSQEFGESVNVTLSTNAENADIRYTLDGAEPSAASMLYENPIILTETTTVKAKVFKGELDPSPTASETYTKVLSAYATWIGQFDLQGEDISPSANRDGDWANNLFERAVGSVPDNVDSAPGAPELSFNAQGRAVFKIHRLTKSAEVNLSIEKSDNLADWELWPTTATVDTETLLELTSIAAITTWPCFLQIKAVE